MQTLILFAHGARDPRWAAPFLRLQQLLQQRADLAVHLAFLEFMPPNLPDLVAQLVANGQHEITLVPVFLGQGGHVLRDLPVLIEQLQTQYPQLQLHRAQAVGEDDSVLQAIAQYCLNVLPAAATSSTSAATSAATASAAPLSPEVSQVESQVVSPPA